jgi:secreted trypsin-like serine protease
MRAFPVAGIVALSALAALAFPAQAVMLGRATRDPDGTRTAVVRVESSAGELCSGALIAPDLVLTAAHCLTELANYRVVGVDRAFRPRQVRAIAAAIHPEFVPGTTPRTQPGVDLAILKLERPLGADFTPLDPRASERVGTGSTVRLAGYGIIAEGQKRTARTLRETSLVSLGPIQVMNRVIVVADGQRLAETTGAGACRGDSGGPILSETRGGYQLLGIVSWSSGAARAREATACGGLTAVTPVAEHVRWIVEGAQALQQFTSGFAAPARRGEGQWMRKQE